MNIPDQLYAIRHLYAYQYVYGGRKQVDIIQLIQQHVASNKTCDLDDIYVDLGLKGPAFWLCIQLQQKSDKTWKLSYDFAGYPYLDKFFNTSIPKRSIQCSKDTAVDAWKQLAKQMGLAFRVQIGTKISKPLPLCPGCRKRRVHRCRWCNIALVHERILEPSYLVTLEKKVLRAKWIVRLLEPLGLSKDVIREVIYPFYTDLYGIACNKKKVKSSP